ncbi:hypothetical protein LTR37_013595 [Vermiconidia calcicola]|uniref:Uncharacterized protein n=1 Tax=Vermiconidia calcicola TaxID=1690605 RepID=A0ACC3MW51_9PEZI|nr:hypothetical protein LTR37_013595 [Vermiconidia calcicola]
MRPTDFRGRPDSLAFPYRQLTILAFMSIFPYIYYMIESFHVTDDDKRIALYAGMVTSAFALAEAMSSSIWGRLSDKYGRKIILLSGLAGTGISMLVFGFAQNLQTALLARALGGLLNGNIGVLQTTVAEVVKVEAHQGVAFALMPTIWCFGAVIGSVLGGGLADPVRNYPDVFQPGGILDRFPYLLPNLVCATVVVIGIVVGILFLEETHEDMQQHNDFGLQIGRWIERGIRKTLWRERFGSKEGFSSDTMILLDDGDQPPDYRSTASSPNLQATAVALPPPYQVLDDGDAEAADHEDTAAKRGSGIWDALTTQLVLNIVGYGILAYHTISAEQLLPVLFSMPESDEPANLPFWFTGGFALSTKTIGGILSVQGALQMISTMVIFPFVQKHFGTLRTFRTVVLLYPFLYLLIPYVTLVPQTLRMPAIYAILVWKVTAQAFAFPANNMMLAHATPRKSLGTFNGIAQSSASLARAIGPSLSGLLEAAGLSHGMLALPWWFSALIATAGAILSLFMVEKPPKATDLEKEDGAELACAFPPAISPDIDAALVAAESTSLSAENVLSRPASPLLVRISVDIRRNAHRGSKS